MKLSELTFEMYFGAALLVCGISWVWDFVSSIYFAWQAAINLTLLSAFVYLEAGLIGAFAFSRRLEEGQVLAGLKVGLSAFLVNMAFRLIVFEFTEAIFGMLIYLVGFMIGSALGGFMAKRVSSSK